GRVPSHDRGIGSLAQRYHDRRLEVITRRNASRLNLGLLAVSSIVVRNRSKRSGTVELQDRIIEHIRNTELRQGRSYPANNHPLGSGTGDDKSSNANVLTCLHKQTRGEVDRLRSRSRTWCWRAHWRWCYSGRRAGALDRNMNVKDIAERTGDRFPIYGVGGLNSIAVTPVRFVLEE